MNASILFVLGLAITLLISVAVVRWLHLPLRKQLSELCGNSERAEFWTAFSSAILSLVPLIFAIQAEPYMESHVPNVFAIVGQIKWGIAGLVFSMLVLAWILGRFIRRHQALPGGVTAAPPQGWQK